MSNSLVFYWDRNDVVHIIDPDAIKNIDDEISPLMMIAIAIINEGYEGVVIDEHRLNSGRYFHAITSNLETHEGQIFDNLRKQTQKLPSPSTVIEKIKVAYASAPGVTHGK